MGRKRKSLEELSLTGTLRTNPARYKKRLAAESAQSAGDSLGEPPVRLPQGAKTVWAEISSTRPWLTAADRLDVELAATLTAKMRNHKTEATRADLALLQRTLAGIDKKQSKRSTPVVKTLPKELQDGPRCKFPNNPRSREHGCSYIACKHCTKLGWDLFGVTFFDSMDAEGLEAFIQRYPDFDPDDKSTHEAVAARITAQLLLQDKT